MVDLVDGVKAEYIKDLTANKEERERIIAGLKNQFEDYENRLKAFEARAKRAND